MNPDVDALLERATRWREESGQLRRIALACGLTEEVKWRQPCYTFQDRNVVLISGFKDYCALAFFKGALLSDARGILVSPGKHSQAMRQIRFTNVRDIVELEPVLKAYILEAIEVERAGLKVEKGRERLAFPEEFQARLDEIPALKAAFDALTPGRQRAYVLYFSGAKRSATRRARVERCVQQILDGKGLNER